ncbi:transcriptional regulator [Fusobacterium necrophorum subsp. funduliforme]|uniref:Transcriptional regulator n=1 Tax=Fusobacterium necrophorum subsp. funduliforme TaxID=143387 RepID=A0A161QTT9_9FUSO|nr:sigma 54-interacting transcriptional regulator [Fusobacterium necrophorum]AYV92350.1 AAA family ATPase [Fusobacterium necrophorum subsp. funduliforme]KYL03596.1 transcriptional regulator [Fusobacterium necrophorum subsp. funduliforme]KYM43188.1 transcriptional regulator [Fusobacterium necrophorum subsp. funduliforme]KYM59532.1 transcriptional regulator [Fusobacterium necrophorum subsp. funduliforme]KYM65128.1 transcriptional regulator [Fusobacterium necrophorum subsp. funduliforme]
MNFLNFILDDVKKYSEIVSKVIGMDVEVMDSSFTRIAGTGSLKEKVGLDMKEESHIYHQVLESKETIIILEPRKDMHCLTCEKKFLCKEELEISTPIMYQDDVIGVIGLICFEKYKKNEFIGKKDLYIQFLKQISEFISYKVYEYFHSLQLKRDNEILSNIIDRVQDIIILTNRKNQIELINKKGKSILAPILKEENIYLKSSSNFLNQKEFKFSYSGKEISGIGDIFSFSLEKNKELTKTLFVFKEISEFKKYLLSFHGNSSIILLESPQMQNIYSQISKVAKNNTSILITGESGTGKEIIAKQIHDLSSYSDGPFITVNCGAIPESLMESELFGYTKGAFTGADPKGKIGFFERAHNGTIFLDEIGEMPLQIQVKMLRVLQDKKITPIGSHIEKQVNVRIIAATNRNLEQEVKKRNFREDLFYRLSVFPIDIPPLRERKKDIKILVNFFVKKYYISFQMEQKDISTEVYQYFLEYSWLGNIRELRNTIEYCMNIIEENEKSIELKHLPPKLLNNKEKDKKIKTLAELERDAIQNLLQIYGNSSEAKKIIAKSLGIGIATLYRKIKNLEV